jgi:hypothetical protein
MMWMPSRYTAAAIAAGVGAVALGISIHLSVDTPERPVAAQPEARSDL